MRLHLTLMATGLLTAIALSSSRSAIAQDYAATAATPQPSTGSSYYQDYQSVVVPTQPSSPPPPTAVPLEPMPPMQGVAPSAQPSLSDPVWVVPSTAPIVPQSVSVPPPPASQPAIAPATTSPSSIPNPSAVPSPSTVPSPAEVALQVTDVQIIGVEPETQAYGLALLQTKPGGQASSTQLQNDITLLENSGFFSNVTVSTQTNPQGLSVIFYARPVTLQALQLTNAQGLSLSVANDIFKNQFGQPITPTALNQAVGQINNWYVQNGYILARVVSMQPTRQGIVVVEVAEGKIGDVKLRFVNREGNTTDPNGQPIRYRTQDAFARRQVKLQPGQAFQVQTAREDIARLQALGIFEQVNVTFEGDATNTTVVYNLQERPPRDLRFGGGYNDTLGLFGTVNIQDVNFGGLGQRLGGTVLVGTRDVQFDGRFVSPYRDTEPNMPGYNANVFRNQGLSSVFTEEVRLPNGDRARERRLGGSVGLEKPIGSGWNGNWGLNYTRVSIRDNGNDITPTDALGNPLTLSGTGIDDLFSFSFSALRDLRDNPINPSSGSFAQVNTEQFFPVGQGNVLGTKFQGAYRYYIPVKWITASHKTPPNAGQAQPETIALEVQGGTWVGDLPPYNAFALGGPFSTRGWDTGAIGSGRSFLAASAEYRFPIYRFIGGAAFMDFSSDLGTGDAVPGEPAIIREKPGTGLGMGVGVRVNSPLGILRGDLGVSNQGDVRFQFGFGQKF